MLTLIRKLMLLLAVSLYVTVAFPESQIQLQPALYLSDDTGAPAAENSAYKGKIIRLTDGTLIAVFGDAIDSIYNAWDFTGKMYSARDVFVSWSKDDGVTWTSPLNISNTAALTDAGAFYDPDGNGADGSGGLDAMNYYGDSGKPNVFAPGNGNNIMVTWADKYCPSGVQGVVAYPAPYIGPDPGVIQVPYSCIYVARLVNTANTVNLVAVDVLTDASRDATGDVPRGGGGGNAIVWQEDPLGLQPGEAEGPGDGGSGARTSNGTDIWYSYLANNKFTVGTWSNPVTVTNNAPSAPGASRPNLFVGKNPDSPGAAWAILAYEERKGVPSLPGKYVIYHVFAYNDPGTGPVPAGSGVIISDPLENARRVRFVAKGDAGWWQGTRMIMFWKQGLEDQGGPSDIMARVGHVPHDWDPLDPATTSYGWRPEDLAPSVAGSGKLQLALSNAPALNLSSAHLHDPSTTNPIDDARAHRAIIVGDFIAVGYTYTPDQAMARYTTHENYDFYLRRSKDGGKTWDTARNLSNLPKDLNVKEPRLVATPSSVKATCPSGDPEAADTSNVHDCQKKEVFYVAWGTELNQDETISLGSINLDLYISRTLNYGNSYEQTVLIASGGVDLDNDETSNGESQMRTTPDGLYSYITWTQTSSEGSELAFVKGEGVKLEENPDSCSNYYPDGNLDNNGDFCLSGGGVKPDKKNGGFCSYHPDGRLDIVLPAMVLIALSYLGWRRNES